MEFNTNLIVDEEKRDNFNGKYIDILHYISQNANIKDMTGLEYLKLYYFAENIINYKKNNIKPNELLLGFINNDLEHVINYLDPVLSKYIKLLFLMFKKFSNNE